MTGLLSAWNFCASNKPDPFLWRIRLVERQRTRTVKGAPSTYRATAMIRVDAFGDR